MKYILVLLAVFISQPSFAQQLNLPTLSKDESIFIIDGIRSETRNVLETSFNGRKNGQVICLDGAESKLYAFNSPYYYFIENKEKCFEIINAIKLALVQRRSVAMILGPRIDHIKRRNSWHIRTIQVVKEVRYY